MTNNLRLERIKSDAFKNRRSDVTKLMHGDVVWLTQQVERADKNKEELKVMDMQLYSTQQQVEKLKKSLKESARMFEESSRRIEELEKENLRYLEALENIQDIQQWHRKEPDSEVLNIVNKVLEEA